MKILPTLHPSINQKRILAKILAAANPKLAGEALVGDQNQVAARNSMMQLGLINYAAGNASLTDKGMQVAREENITDDAGNLTDMGNTLAGVETAPPPAPTPAPPTGGLTGEVPPLESEQRKYTTLLQELFNR